MDPGAGRRRARGPLHFFFDDPRPAILALEKLGRFRAVEEPLRRGVDDQLLATDAVTDIGVMDQERTAVPIEDVGVGQLAAADALDEVLLVRVPDEVAILSVDNDEYLCRLADPPLTSIDVNPERIGYEAAALLERMMAGSAPPAKPIEIEPRGIVARHSSDVLAIEDREVAAVLRYIRQHACEGINVAQLVNHSTLSRSALERRFKKLLDGPPRPKSFASNSIRPKGCWSEPRFP